MAWKSFVMWTLFILVNGFIVTVYFHVLMLSVSTVVSKVGQDIVAKQFQSQYDMIKKLMLDGLKSTAASLFSEVPTGKAN